MVSTASLSERAANIMTLNDRQKHTVPSSTLYPHQWAWDSAFAAIGWACLDPNRALTELETLMRGQWSDGRVPHIQFSPEVTETYFPDANFWEAEHSSSITQPPVWAMATQRILRRGGNPERIKALLPAIERSHLFFHKQRDPLKWGLVSVAHPWESGLDNSPAWDSALEAIDPKLAPPFNRVDKGKVRDANQRPTDEEYKRYAVLVKAIAHDHFGHGPFKVYCPLMTTLLAHNELALAKLSDELNYESEAELRAQRLKEGLDRLYNEAMGRYDYYDIQLERRESLDILGAYAPVMLRGSSLEPRGTGRMIEQLVAHYQSDYGLPTTPSRSPHFDPKRYWRGPIWVNMNWLYAEALADTIPLRDQTLKLLDRSGFSEYFNPLNGEGLGADEFTWSAALCLDWLN